MGGLEGVNRAGSAARWLLWVESGLLENNSTRIRDAVGLLHDQVKRIKPTMPIGRHDVRLRSGLLTGGRYEFANHFVGHLAHGYKEPLPANG